MNKTKCLIRLTSVLLLFALTVGCTEGNLLGPKVPVKCFQRDSLTGNGKVVIVENTSDKTLRVWISALGSKTDFSVGPGEKKEFGWMEGFEFGENSTCTIGGEGYSPVTFSWGS